MVAKTNGKDSRMSVDQFAEFQSAVARCLPRDLNSETAQQWINNQKDLEHVLQHALQEFRTPLLQTLSEVEVPTIIEPFVASEKFAVDTSVTVGAKISYVGDNFKACFFGGHPEQPSGKATLCCAKLLKSSLDESILKELGATAKTTLSQIYALMARQKNGENGVLLTNGLANVFYVKDLSGVLRAVSVHWCGDGWYVDADSIGYPHEWGDGRHVFSRKS